MSEITGTGMIEHTYAVEIDAPRERVWKALTDQAGAWWHPGFMTRKETLAFRIEARLGGHAFEDWGDGQGLVWYTVTGILRNELLQLSGDLDLHHGPARLQTTFRLEDLGGRTRVTMEESAFGRTPEKLKQDLAAGWRVLLEGCLKVFVETGAPPSEWPMP